jgi:hypothetical protein
VPVFELRNGKFVHNVGAPTLQSNGLNDLKRCHIVRDRGALFAVA